MKADSMTPNTPTEWATNTRPQTSALVLATKEVLQQGLRLLESCGEKYALAAPAPFDASVGRHFRHVLEHFHCLLQGVNNGEVNYDARKRDARIETEASFAAGATNEVIRQIELWTEVTLAQRCSTVSSLAYHSDSPSFISSNLGRELAYCIGHAIHHFAIIRLLCGHIGVKIPADFGYAPSTLKYQSSLAAD
ncbi:MAG TPA: hypothetical protein VGH37_15875 [Candidatus Acidoferrum sp.]|jgi:uncharacterized damage-inducible protein DinB